MALLACPACSGLVPAARSRCVHCDAVLARRWGWLRRTLTATVTAAATVTLMACYGGPSVLDDCVDRDGDGWFPGCYDEPCDPRQDPYCDCDDGDPSVHPGAPDPLGDDRDTDCSGDDGPAKCGEGPCPDAGEWPDADVEPWPDASTPPDAGPPDGMEDAPVAPDAAPG